MWQSGQDCFQCLANATTCTKGRIHIYRPSTRKMFCHCFQVVMTHHHFGILTSANASKKLSAAVY